MPDRLLTADELTARGWSKRGARPAVFRLDLIPHPGCWLLLTDDGRGGWKPEFVRLGLRLPHAVVVTTGDLERFFTLVRRTV